MRTKAEAALRDLDETNHEKVLVVKTSGYPRENEDTFGIEWRCGWRIAKLGVVLDESRSYMLEIENYDEDDEPVMAGEFRIGSKPGHRGKQNHKTAVIPWTKEREDILRRTVEAIGEMRNRLNEQLLKPDMFAGLLDQHAGALLLKPPEDCT